MSAMRCFSRASAPLRPAPCCRHARGARGAPVCAVSSPSAHGPSDEASRRAVLAAITTLLASTASSSARADAELVDYIYKVCSCSWHTPLSSWAAALLRRGPALTHPCVILPG